MLTEIHLCHACSDHEIVRVNTAGQVWRLHAPPHDGGGERAGLGGSGGRRRAEGESKRLFVESPWSSLSADASGLDTHRDSISSRFDCRC
jgi:hypothetical protein